jgi:hypothetical protein
MFRIDLKASAARAASGETAAAGAASSARAFLPVVLVLGVLAGALWAVGARADRNLAARQQEALRLEAAVQDARQRLAEATGRQRDQLLLPREEIYWSDQLRTLSGRVSDKIWIDRISVSTSGGGDEPGRRSLSITGGVLSSEHEANLDLIGECIETLQSDERFRQAFGEVALESVNRGAADSHALNFVLSAPFRS